MCQGNFDRDTARSILEIAVKSLWPPPRRFARHFYYSIGTMAHWIVPAIFGDRIARGIAEAHVMWAQAGLLLARAIGSESILNARFKGYRDRPTFVELVTVLRQALTSLRRATRVSIR